MGRLRCAAAALGLALLIPLLGHAMRVLPVDTRPLVAEKYAGWSGVLRLWVFEGWRSGSGSLSGWINRCASRFEKRHPGVYVQPQYVDEGAIAALNDSGILPPDMLLFPPGLLDAPAGLSPLEPPDGLRPALARCGMCGGATYAVPVALGGYLWAWNPALTGGIPGDWAEAGLMPAVPEPERWRHWDAALLALCTRLPEASPIEGEAHPPTDTLPGLDLGLALSDGPTPAPSTPPEAPAPLTCRLPDSFAFDADAWRRFINGEAPALAATQWEVRRLEALADRGRGPDWRLSPCGAFTDQLLMLAVTAKPEGDARAALCREFLEAMLSDESQGELCRASAFAVTDAASGYVPGDSLATLDAALRDPGLCVPDAFDAGWPEAAAGIVREFIAGGGDPRQLWRRFTDRLAEIPNINS